MRIVNSRALLLFAAALASAGCTQSTTPCVTPIGRGGTYAGRALDDWSAAWWQSVYSVQGEVAAHPFLDETGAACAAAQPSADVWFLHGSGNTGPIVRTCTVPPGRALFFPLLTGSFDNAGATTILSPAELMTAASEFYAGEVALVCEVDGCAVPNLDTYFIPPVEFTYVVPPPPNLYTAFGGAFEGPVDPSYSIGWWIMLPPLPAGAHTIHLGGTRFGVAGDPADDFIVDVTYRLTIE